MSRGAALAQHERMKRWVSWVAVNGNRARVINDTPACTPEDAPRQVHVHQERHGELDLDALPGSCKPIIDGLTRQVRRSVKGKMTYFPGARLLWDDKPRWLNKITVSQTVVPKYEPTKVTIIVEIPE